MIQKIKIDELRTMSDKEALILRGCGGNLQEWVDGISKELRENGILKGDFQDCLTFKDENSTCLLFPFEGADLDVGKLAMWRLKTAGAFGGTWLSDFVENCLGGFIENAEEQQERKKPDCPLIGQDSNIFNLLGIASRTLKRNNMQSEAKEMQSRVLSSGSYADALCIIGDYVNITSVDDEESQDEIMNMGVS